MKPVLLTLFIICFSFSASAQDYRCLQLGSVPYFTSQEHHLKGIRVDSVKNINNDTHFFLYHTPRGSYNISMPQLDTNGGSWVGKEVIEKTDGATLFNNLWGDTVIIHTQANLNDSWMFYNDTSQNYYVATATALDTTTISGAADSIKTITISAYNASGLNSADSINGKQIILSKAHGIYQTFALYTFPFPTQYVAMDYYMDMTEKVNDVIQIFKKEVLVTNPTTFDLYDSQPGDIFQYHGSFYFIQDYKKEDSVISRQLVSNSQLEYVLGTKEISINGPNLTTRNYLDTVNINYEVLKWFDSTLMPDESHNMNFIKYNPIDKTHCLETSKYTTTSNNIYNGVINNFEPTTSEYIYKIGFGLTYNYIFSGSYPNNNTDIGLYYTLKNGISCGNKILLAINELQQVDFSISPNPADRFIQIQTPLENYIIIVYNTLGLKMKEMKLNRSNQQIDVSDLPNGIYFLKFYTKDLSGYISKKIIVQH